MSQRGWIQSNRGSGGPSGLRAADGRGLLQGQPAETNTDKTIMNNSLTCLLISLILNNQVAGPSRLNTYKQITKWHSESTTLKSHKKHSPHDSHFSLSIKLIPKWL